jgi:hypothetical protein
VAARSGGVSWLTGRGLIARVAQQTWADLERLAPELAASGRELLERFGFVLVGTIRKDGTPRISPVEVQLVNGHLMLVMIPHSRKARDVRRDPRVVLQSPVLQAQDPGDELKLRGRVVEVDEAQRTVTTDAIEARSGWRPHPSWLFLSLDIESATHISWHAGDMVLTRWDAGRGVPASKRLRLDLPAGEYRPLE